MFKKFFSFIALSLLLVSPVFSQDCSINEVQGERFFDNERKKVGYYYLIPVNSRFVDEYYDGTGNELYSDAFDVLKNSISEGLIPVDFQCNFTTHIVRNSLSSDYKDIDCFNVTTNESFDPLNGVGIDYMNNQFFCENGSYNYENCILIKDDSGENFIFLNTDFMYFDKGIFTGSYITDIPYNTNNFSSVTLGLNNANELLLKGYTLYHLYKDPEDNVHYYLVGYEIETGDFYCPKKRTFTRPSF